MLFRAPGRVNIIGEHTDYNDGLVLPTNTALYTWLTIRPRIDRTIQVSSRNLDDTQSFSLDDIRRSERPGWLDYVKGVAALLQEDDFRLCGAEITIEGDIPIGAGLSSSASLELATAKALLHISGAELQAERIAELCQRAEQVYAGVHCGIMDQYSISCCNRGEAMMLDCRSLEATPVAIPKNVSFLLTDSGVKHRLPDGGYNNRANECQQAVEVLAETETGIQSLRDVSVLFLQETKERLGENLFRRSRHVVSENQRVVEAIPALQSGDLNNLGALISASHASLRDDFEVSCTEVETLVEIADACDGVTGSRMVGAGFGGCVLSAVHTDHLDATINRISETYGDVIGKRPWIHAVAAADPAGKVSEQ
jgi:galactokinase